MPGTHAVVIVTALSLGPYRGSADALLRASLVLDAVMLACTYVLTRLAVGRALRPVRSMTAQATHWDAVGSEERYGAAHHPVELARLGGSLDVLLDRIRSVLRHERQLTGELPHELRTPPTRMVVELDWWRARPRSAAETWATVTVSARRTADGVRVEVTDDGPGVPGDFVGELFTPGRRADGDDGHDGAGMGLPLARRLARSVGGEVSFDSGCTRGARFTITLPAH